MSSLSVGVQVQLNDLVADGASMMRLVWRASLGVSVVCRAPGGGCLPGPPAGRVGGPGLRHAGDGRPEVPSEP